MRPRTILLALAGVLFINTLIVLGAWLWLRPATGAGLDRAAVETLAGNSESVTAAVGPAPPAPPSSAGNSALPRPEIGATWAEIVSPQNGQAVPRRFPVTGRCGSLPAGSSLMLVIDSGRGVYSPKFPLPVVTGENWSGTGNDFGAPVGGSISLCVFVVTDEGARQIAEWHAQGKATGKWPPFRQSVPGGVELQRVKLTIAR